VSRSSEVSAQDRDEGFTLVEVLVSIAILLVLIAAVLPLLITGIRTTDVVRGALQEKGLAQTELERMRNLPFHVATSAGNYVDVLDRYYPNLTAPGTTNPSCGTSANWSVPATTWTGYLSATAPRCSWEPPGPLYRTVRTTGTTVAGDPLPQGFVLVVDTQFLTDATPPVAVAPATGYNRTQVSKDRMPSRQIGVTIAVFRTGRVNSNPMTTYSQIVKRDQLAPLVRSAVDATAVSLGITTATGLPLTVAAGRLDLNATLTQSSTATAVLAGVNASTSSGATGGSITTATAPPAASLAAQDTAAGQIDPDGCALACWGTTRRSAVALSAADGLPTAGSPTAPLQASVRDLTNQGLSLGAGAGATYLGQRTGPVIKVTGAGVRTGNSGCATAESGDVVPAVSSGWLRTTLPEDPANPSLVEACGLARATTVAVVPTTFAPDGVLRVTLTAASVSCRVAGAGHTPTYGATFDALVEYWTPTGYVTAGQVNQTTLTDPLAAVPLTTPLGANGVLGDYIESWSMLTKSGIRGSTGAGQASVQLPGVVNLTTKPVRANGDGTPDEQSVATMSLGTLSCVAKDQR
jgi:prepilin-type N-terminal cleavage/methylation domain-containing protein